MSHDDRKYHANRAQDELDRAVEALDPSVASIHRELAALHRRRMMTVVERGAPAGNSGRTPEVGLGR